MKEGSRMENRGIVVAGGVIVDIYYGAKTYPKEGRLSNIDFVEQGVGGSGNLILDLAKMDNTLPVTVNTIIGDGSNGRFVNKIFAEHDNIDTSAISHKGKTPMTIVVDSEDSKERTFLYLAGSSDEFDETYIPWEELKGKIFHLEYLLLMKKVDSRDEVFGTHGAKILHQAKQRGWITSVDAVSREGDEEREIVACALKYTDICSINELEAENVTGIKLLEAGEVDEKKVVAALREMKRLGVAKWAVIHSPKYSYGLDCVTQEIVKVKSLQLPSGYIKGTTGAGDAFCGGILYSAHEGKSLEEAMEFATASAACSLSATGGSEGMRNYKDIWAIYHKYR